MTDTVLKKYGEIGYETKDEIGILTINRPEKMNSITHDGFSNLYQALVEADADKKAKIIIVTGAGNQAFCAGFDVLNIPTLPIADSRLLHIANLNLNKKLMEMNKITIAAVNGIALGTGFEISLLCDLTVAAKSAIFGMPETAFGGYPGTLAPLVWYMLGHKRANEFLLTNKRMSASEAAAVGIVNEVVPAERLMDKTLELAKKIIRTAPLPVAIFKTRTNSMLRMLLEEEMSRFIEVQTLAFGSRDFKEGISALKEKRKPIFRGE